MFFTHFVYSVSCGGRMMKTNFIPTGLIALSLLVTGCKESASFYTNSLRSQIFVQPNTNSRYDFLWVLDNSGSMKPRRDYIKDNLDSFLEVLNSRKAIDYQMAVVTTDAMRDSGSLVTASSGLQVVKSSQSSNPTADFAEIVNSISDSNTSFWEQGLENSYQATLKYSQRFSRDGVPLMVIYLTDEEDFSCKEQCWGSEPENNENWIPFSSDRYIDFFKSFKTSEESEVVMFPIVGMNPERCAVPSLGSRYVEVMTGVGSYGTAGSICDVDLAESYNNIAKVIADRGNVFYLNAKASRRSLRVFVDNVLQDPETANYSFDETLNALVFNGKLPPAGSVIEVVFEEIK